MVFYKFIERKWSMDQGDFMKLFNQFNVLQKYLTALQLGGVKSEWNSKRTWEIHYRVSNLLG